MEPAGFQFGCGGGKILRDWPRKGSEKFRKFAKKLKKIEKCIILTYFSKCLKNPALNFLTLVQTNGGKRFRKTEKLQKIRRKLKTAFV